MPNIIQLLLDFINSEDHESVNYMIANYLLSHVNDAEDISISKIANECNVSKATVSRFCKKIGLHDFYEFKYIYQNNRSDTMIKYFPLIAKSNDCIDNYLMSVVKSLNELKSTFDKNELIELTKDIIKYKKVATFGHLQSGKVATTLQDMLFSNDKYVYSALNFQNQKDYILNANEDDLIIIFSSSGKYFERMFSRSEYFHKKNKPKIYMITNLSNPISSPYTDNVIYLPSHNLLSTTMLLQCYADLISLVYFQLVFKK